MRTGTEGRSKAYCPNLQWPFKWSYLDFKQVSNYFHNWKVSKILIYGDKETFSLAQLCHSLAS